jgi:Ca2+-transporting ATPase
MATGDLPSTAYAVGRSLGWDIEPSAVITGDHLQQLSDDELMEMLPRLRIFARVTPTDKVRIAQLYQRRGEVVAMTGDGVNDGPALKAANIGIALGSGTDVAKSIADLVLLDDNFKTIVSTISEGKQMLANIKKIFVYLMSNALDEVILISGSIIVGVAMPLTAVQIIWVNLFTGCIPAISYAFDKQPLSSNSRGAQVFFDNNVKFLTFGVGILSSVMLFLLYVTLLALAVPLEIAQSVLFVCFSAYILVVAFSFRNLEKPLFSYSLIENKPLVVGVLLGLVLIGLTVYLPFFQNMFKVTALGAGWMMFVVVWLAVNVALVEGAKWLSRTYFAN